MDLYLIRHAQAVDGGLRDDDRPLSAVGRRQALDVGRALAGQKVHFTRVVTSPLVRAVETAELVAVATEFDGELVVADALRPDGGWNQLQRDVLDGLDGAAVVALVGHEPSIGHFLSKLINDKGLSMSKGAVVRLAFERAGEPARVVWTLSPKHLDPSPTL